MLERFSHLRKKLFAPFLINVNPLVVSLLAFSLAIAAGYFLFASRWVAAALLIGASAFLDALDGEIARKHRRATKFGDMIDHTLDRLADSALFIALALNNFGTLAFLALTAVLLASYAGTEAQALTGKRLYTALAGRADRLAILFIAAITQPFYKNSITIGLYAILFLSALTFLQRTYLTAKKVRP